jgi:glycosyltransferase involved in cell wall biosynthesis
LTQFSEDKQAIEQFRAYTTKATRFTQQMKVLIGVPAYNEEATILGVLQAVREALSDTDIAVVNDGSHDRTAEVVLTSQTGAALLNMPCNHGYSTAIETLLRYAHIHHYDVLVLIDADGQHNPDYLPHFLKAFETRKCDVLIGSRFLSNLTYKHNPPGRRIGMLLFSYLTIILAGKRILDTTSGMKAIGANAIKALLGWQFLDFHAEAILFLLWSGYSIDEYPITVKEREHGQSMYSALSHLWYPLMLIVLIMITRLHLTLLKESPKNS